MGKNDFHGSLGQALPLPSRAPYGKTLERVPKFSYLGVVLDGEPFLYGKITSSMLAARSVGGLGFCLVYDRASRRKPLNRYTHHFCSRYLIMLMLISEGCCKKLQRLQNSAARIIVWQDSANDTFHVLNWLNLASIRKMHKCMCVFQFLSA